MADRSSHAFDPGGTVFHTMGRISTKTVVVFGTAAALATLISVAAIQRSLEHGRLSAPPQYDDVSYFIFAATWLSLAESRSIGESLYGLLEQHSPFTAWMAILGLLVWPDRFIGPYALNGFVIAGFLLGLARLVWNLPTTLILACLIGAATIPVLTQTVTEARPDLPWGLALGLALVAIVRLPLIGRSLKSIFLLGLLVGLAVAIKPTALPASLACIAGALGISLIRDRFDRRQGSVRVSIKELSIIAAIFFCGLTLALAPVLIVNFKHLTGYILQVLVYDRDFWKFDASLFDHIKLYTIGYAGNLALGIWFYLGLLLFGIRFSLGYFFKRSDLGRAFALYAVVFLSYLIPNLTTVKSYYLGAMFYGTFIAACAVNFSHIMDLLISLTDSRFRMAMFALKIGSLLLALLVFSGLLAHGKPQLASIIPEREASNRRMSTDRVWSRLRELAPMIGQSLGRPTIVVFPNHAPVNRAVIGVYAAMARVALDTRELYQVRTIESAHRRLAGADIIVLQSSIPSPLPGPRMSDDLIRAFEANPDWCLAESFDQIGKGVVRIYIRRQAACPMAGSPR